jgi:hypothetical protein
VPTVEVAVAATSVLVVSVAVSTHAPVTPMVSALKVATPAKATAVVVPPRVHGEVIAIESPLPIPKVTTLPLASSTETLKVVSTVPAVVTAAGGAVEKATCVAAPAVNATTVLVAVASVLDVSVAINWQLLPVLIATAENVAASFMAVTDVVPVSTHADVRTMTSEVPTPPWRATPLLASTDTTNVGSTVPAAAVAGGSTVKPSSVGVFDTKVIAGLVTVKPLSGESVSVAMSVQLVPALK